MKKGTLDCILKVLLTIILFAVPISLAMVIWCTPSLESNGFTVGMSAVNLVFGLAEIMFLVRSVIFPRGGKKWWRAMDW